MSDERGFTFKVVDLPGWTIGDMKLFDHRLYRLDAIFKDYPSRDPNYPEGAEFPKHIDTSTPEGRAEGWKIITS